MTRLTYVLWGRPHTDEENAKVSAKIASATASGATTGKLVVLANEAYRDWATLELAEEFINWVNTFDPPPFEARVVAEDEVKPEKFYKWETAPAQYDPNNPLHNPVRK